jgi:hypothetical protein
MSATAAKRLALSLGAAVIAAVVAEWIGLRPRPVLLVLTVVAGLVWVWLVEDLAADRYDLNLDAPRGRLLPRWGLDARFSRLSSSLRPPYDPGLVAGQVHPTLVAIVDDRLLANHGVDRATEPDRARAVMGPKLAAYVEGPPSPRRNLIAHLSEMVTRIEAL